MTVKEAVFEYFDSLQSCNISGWKLFDHIASVTGKHSYPTTLLNYAREYADISAGSFNCIDNQRSIYHFEKGFVLGPAIIAGKE